MFVSVVGPSRASSHRQTLRLTPKNMKWRQKQRAQQSSRAEDEEKVPVNGQFLRTAVNIQPSANVQRAGPVCVEREKIYVRFTLAMSSKA